MRVHSIRNRRGQFVLASGAALLFAASAATPALAQSANLLGVTNAPAAVCVGASGLLFVNNSSESCILEPGAQFVTGFTTGNATFNTNSTFSGGTVSFNSVTTAFGGGSVSFNNPVTFTGSSATFSTPTTFNNPSTFSAAVTSNGITNTGNIGTQTLTTGSLTSGATSTGSLAVSSQLLVNAGAVSVNFSGNQIHGVGAGAVTAASTDAINGSQLFAVQQTASAGSAAVGAGAAAAFGGGASYNSGTNTFTGPSYSIAGGTFTDVGSALTALDDVSFELSRDIDRNRKEARRGIAAAAAMGNAAMPSGPGRTSYVANVSHYRGEMAFGASVAHRFDTRTPFALTAGISHGGKEDTIIRGGVAGEF